MTRNAILVGILLAPASVLQAQAICSAPHSSPTLAGGTSIGTLAPRSGWVMTSALVQRSSELFNTRGDRQPFLADGRFRTASIYLSAGAGLVTGLDVWAQVPLHNMRYADTGGERRRSGVGDIRLAARVSPALIGRSFPVALRVGAKVPGSDFPIDATVIPLTEGQRDVEVSLESGRTFANRAWYVMGWSGLRWRSENRKAARKPGDEFFTHLATGTAVAGLRLELGSDLLIARNPRQLGLVVPASRRRLWQLAPTVTRKVGIGDLEFTSVVPVIGRNLPTGAGFSAGYRIGWGNRTPTPRRARGFEVRPAAPSGAL